MPSGRPDFFINYLRREQSALIEQFKSDAIRRNPSEMVFFLYVPSVLHLSWKKVLLHYFTNVSLLPIDEPVLSQICSIYDADAASVLSADALKSIIDKITEAGFSELFEPSRAGEKIKIRDDIAAYLQTTFGTQAPITDEIFLMRAYTQTIWNTLIEFRYDKTNQPEKPIDYDVRRLYFASQSINDYFKARLEHLKNSGITYEAAPKEPSAATPLSKGDIAAISVTVLFATVSLLEAPLFLLLLIPISALFYSRHQNGNYFFNKRVSGDLSSSSSARPGASASSVPTALVGASY